MKPFLTALFLLLLLLVAPSHSTTHTSMVSASDQNFRNVNVVSRKGGGGGGHGGGHGGHSGGRGGRSRGYTAVIPLYAAGAGAHNMNNNHHHGTSSGGSLNRIGVAHVAFSTLVASFAFLFA